MMYSWLGDSDSLFPNFERKLRMEQGLILNTKTPLETIYK